MLGFLGSDDEEPEYGNDHDWDDDWGFGVPRARRFPDRNFRDTYFLKIQQSVTEQQNKPLTPEDEEILFSKISLYLKKPFTLIGILTLQRLAFIPPTVSHVRLKEIAKIICKTIFNPLPVTDDYISVYVDFCKGFAYLQATTDRGERITFEQILTSEFLDHLPKTFGYAQRLSQLLYNLDIPVEKKKKWLEKQTENQKKVFNIISHQSITFLDKLFQLYPEIVYRVLEFLLALNDNDGFQYLYNLLETVRFHGSKEEYTKTDIYQMKLTHWERNQRNAIPMLIAQPLPLQGKTLGPLFENITHLSNTNHRITARMRDLIHTMVANPVKENTPQDYIKYSIKDCIHYEKFTPLDDFFIEDEEKYGCEVYTLRCKDFTSPGPMLFWRGLRLKILVEQKRSRKPPFARARTAVP